jgi:hypothetical protein
MELHNVLDDRQTEAQAGEAPLCCLCAPVENVWQKLRWYAFAGIRDLDDRKRAITQQAGLDQTAGGSEFDRVAEKVGEHLTRFRRMVVSVTVQEDANVVSLFGSLIAAAARIGARQVCGKLPARFSNAGGRQVRRVADRDRDRYTGRVLAATSV